MPAWRGAGRLDRPDPARWLESGATRACCLSFPIAVSEMNGPGGCRPSLLPCGRRLVAQPFRDTESMGLFLVSLLFWGVEWGRAQNCWEGERVGNPGEARQSHRVPGKVPGSRRSLRRASGAWRSGVGQRSFFYDRCAFCGLWSFPSSRPGPGSSGHCRGSPHWGGRGPSVGLGEGRRAGVGCRTLDFITQPGFYSRALESGSGGGVEGGGEKSLMMLGT